MDSTGKFTGMAEGYAKYRPQYSGEFIDYLVEACSLGRGSVIADIGSGTGMLSRQLLDKGLAVLAVEPNRDMREAAEKLLHAYPAFTSVKGAAEVTTLADCSVDLVTVAQAFHWFDREKFKAECQRILKSGAKAALVWNSRVEGSGLARENEEICRRLCPNFVGHSGGIETTPGVFEQFFRDGLYEYRTFQNDEHYSNPEAFIGRGLSASYAPKENDGNYDAYVGELARLYDRHCVNGVLTLPAETHSYMGLV